MKEVNVRRRRDGHLGLRVFAERVRLGDGNGNGDFAICIVWENLINFFTHEVKQK